MYTPIKEFREKLKAGQFCLGVGITLSDPAVTEALGRNVDFYWIDMEHTPLNMETLQSHLIAARAVGIPAIVRVPGSEVWFIKRVLDTGAAGIIVPQVRSAAEVQQVVDACRYKPAGDRGYGPRRASGYGRDAAYMDRINEDLFVSAQIENVDGLREVGAIAQIKGLDSLVLGPYDLSASLGLMGQVAHPEVVKAIDHVIKTAKANGLFVGMGGPANEEYILRGAKLGVQWQQAGSDFEYMIQYVEGVFAALAKKLPGCQPGRVKEQSRY